MEYYLLILALLFLGVITVLAIVIPVPLILGAIIHKYVYGVTFKEAIWDEIDESYATGLTIIVSIIVALIFLTVLFLSL